MGEVQRDALKMRFVHQTERYKILVFFEKSQRIGKREIEQICDRLGEDKRCIVVLDGSVSPAAKTQIDAMAPEVIFEIFPEEKLLVNITEHRLVPKHQPLTEAQKQAVLER